ncbi:MAG: diacylglycerol kinase family lipid kinase [Elusimicrobia bacterium]|nr:diacylglycerol kinase family lipid kinase [Elusimicrobiota bacterium]
MASTVFILNPMAGNGRAERVWETFRDDILRTMPDASCMRTDGPGHAGDIACEAVAGGATRLIAVGGDGTVSEVLEGVMRSPPALRHAAALACLPAGSGCDLARHLAYPKDRQGLLDLIAGGQRRLVDVGRVRYTRPDGSERERHFINIAAFGVAGDVARHIQRKGKALGGRFSYALASARVLLGARAKTLRLYADGRDLSGRYHMGVLANTSSMGGGMLIAPGALDDDGALDLVLVSDMSRLRLLWNLPRIYNGTHLNEDGVSLRRVRSLKVKSDETVYLNIDGEADGMLPASFEVLPRAVAVLAPVA